MPPGCLPTSTVPTSRSVAGSTSDSVDPSKWETHSESPTTVRPAADRPVSRTTAAGSITAGDGEPLVGTVVGGGWVVSGGPLVPVGAALAAAGKFGAAPSVPPDHGARTIPAANATTPRTRLRI